MEKQHFGLGLTGTQIPKPYMDCVNTQRCRLTSVSELCEVFVKIKLRTHMKYLAHTC